MLGYGGVWGNPPPATPAKIDEQIGNDAFTWAPVSEPGFLHFSKMFRKLGILEKFLEMVSKNGSAQDRIIIVGRLLQN